MSDFQVGERVWAYGLTVQNKPKVMPVTITRIFPRDDLGRDCAVQSKDGLRVLVDSRQLFKSNLDVK